LENHLLSTVHDFLFNIFAATLHIKVRSSIRHPRTRHAVVTGNHLSWHIRLITPFCFVSTMPQLLLFLK
jgi:hypothetical protein